jgi:hypothetical protein
MHIQARHPNRSKAFGSYAPYMVVNPGESLVTAAVRHRRETGHRGQIIVAAINAGAAFAA